MAGFPGPKTSALHRPGPRKTERERKTFVGKPQQGDHHLKKSESKPTTLMLVGMLNPFRTQNLSYLISQDTNQITMIQ